MSDSDRSSPSRRVLIVEDDPAICSSISEALREEGFDVATAAHGRAALELLRTAPRPSAIVLDLMMPVMDGWDFRHEQLRDPALKDIPVVVVTAAGFSVDTVRTQFGNVALISKPVPYLDLLEALGRACTPAPPRA
jgi:CheY-like chemotaxis protein